MKLVHVFSIALLLISCAGIANKQHIQTEGKSVFVFNPHTLRWYAYNREGNLVASGHGSGGKDYCKDIQEPCRTPVGTFYVHSFGGADCLSGPYPGHEEGFPMPYCMHTTGDFAIHGFSNVPNYNASHGCIRVSPSTAKWLQDNVIEYGTKVIVMPY